MLQMKGKESESLNWYEGNEKKTRSVLSSALVRM